MSALPTPAGWKNRYLLLSICGVAISSMFAYSVYMIVIAAEESHWLAMSIALCAAVAFGIMAGGVVVLLTAATKLRGRFDESGTTFEAVPAGVWMVLVCAATGIAGGLYLLFGDRVHDDLPTLSNRASGRLIVLVAICVIGTVYFLRNMSKGKPTLTLSPEGIDYRFPGDCMFNIAWDDIVDINGVPLAKRGKGTRPIVFECADGTRAIIAHANTWVPGGTALFWMCRHYWQYPAHRGELVTGVALERLACERIPVA